MGSQWQCNEKREAGYDFFREAQSEKKYHNVLQATQNDKVKFQNKGKGVNTPKRGFFSECLLSVVHMLRKDKFSVCWPFFGIIIVLQKWFSVCNSYIYIVIYFSECMILVVHKYCEKKSLLFADGNMSL